MQDKRMSKSELVQTIADRSGITKKQATMALEELDKIVAQQLGSAGEVTLPGLVKFNVVTKPAVPERKGINPFTKQPMTFKAKPARRVVKARILKGLRDAL